MRIHKAWYWFIRGLHHVVWYLQYPLDALESEFQEWEFQAAKKAFIDE